MKILMLPSYYSPEKFASAHLNDDFEQAWVDAGFDIEYFVPAPTRGVDDKTRAQYRKKKFETEHDGHITIHRFSMFREGRNPLLRALRYALVNIAQYFKGVRVKDADVIFSASTPPIQGMLCSLLKKRLMIPFVYNLQDIFPDSLSNVGMTRKGSLIWKLGRKIEDYTYRNADRIIVISDGFKRNIMEKGVPEDKIFVVHNWVDTYKVRPVPKEDNTLFEELRLDREKLYVTYAGNLGLAQDVGLLLDAADLLKDQADIHFLIFGEGVEKENLAARIKNMDNVTLFPLMPQERISEVYSLGMASMVLGKKDVGKAGLPSKIWSIMATGTPVLASIDADAELKEILESNQCGIVLPAGNAKAVAEAVKKAQASQDEFALMGKNARTCVIKGFSREVCAGQYVNIIKSSASRKPS